MVGKTVSHYKILEKLGSGGMGVVYKAQDLKLERFVALKFLPQDLTRDAGARKRFIQEGKAASALEHPNICSIYEIDETEDDQIFIAMAFYDGESLSDHLKREPLKPEEAAAFCIKIAEGLKEAHHKGIIHRDIKSANIMITAKRQVKIMDFGLARFPGGTKLTKTGSALGTAPFMSPEQISGDEVTHQTDLWSLGVVLYEMLTGQLPFKGEYEQALLFSIVNEDPPPLQSLRPDLPREFQLIVDRSLEKRTDRRYGSAQEIIEDMNNLGGSGSFSSISSGGKARKAAKRSYLSDYICDIYISYAPIDDKPMSQGHSGWISTLHQALEVRLEQLIGSEVRIVRDDAAALNSPDKKTEKKFYGPALFIPVISPHYVKSKTCAQELKNFIDNASQDHGLIVNNKARIHKAVKTQLPPQSQPESLSDYPDFNFYQLDQDSGRPREFWPELGAEANRNFWARLEDIAYEAFQALKAMKAGKQTKKKVDSRPILSPGAATIFLAESTYELTGNRDRIKRQLQQRGHIILPDKPISFNAEDLKKQIADDLLAAKLSIHLIGEKYGIIPEGEKRSVAEIQYDLALSHSKNEAFSRIIWMPPGLHIKDERQQRFVDAIQMNISSQFDTNVLQTSLDEFKNYLIEKMSKLTQLSEKLSAEDDIVRIYLQCDQSDLDATTNIEEYLFDQGFEVKLTAFEGDETEVFEAHKDNLLLCDGTIIYYGEASDSWVSTKMADLLKIAGYGRSKPMKAKAVYITSPETKNKQRFRTREALTLKSFKGFEPGVLKPFISTIQNGKELNG